MNLIVTCGVYRVDFKFAIYELTFTFKQVKLISILDSESNDKCIDFTMNYV